MECRKNSRSCFFLVFLWFVFLNFLFCIGVQFVNTVEPVSGVQQNDSVIHAQVSLAAQTVKNLPAMHETQV